MSFKSLLEKPRSTVKVRFLGENIDVVKMNVAEVEDFQKALKGAKDEEGIKIQRDIVRLGVPEARDLTDDELNQFPMDDFIKLAEEILKQAGIRNDSGK